MATPRQPKAGITVKTQLVMFTIAIHIPTWKRPGVVDIMVQHLRHQATELEGQGIRLWPFFIHSPEDPMPYDWTQAAKEGAGIVTCSNARLGIKWNTGWQAIKKACAHLDPGQVCFMQLGSDNLISSQYLESAVALIKTGAEVVGINEAVFYDLATGRCGKVKPGVPFGYGPGRMYSSSVLDYMHWAPYRPQQQQRMERTIDNRLRMYRPRVTVLEANYDPLCMLCLVDIKTKQNIWSYDKARNGRLKHSQWTDLEAYQVCYWFTDVNWPSHLGPVIQRGTS